VSNLPSGCTSTSILEVLNKALSQQNISLSVDEDCYLSKQYIEIEFAYFVDALQAVHLMNNLSFQVFLRLFRVKTSTQSSITVL